MSRSPQRVADRDVPRYANRMTIRRTLILATVALSLAGCGGTAVAAQPAPTTPAIGRAVTLRTSAGAEIAVTPVKVLPVTQPDRATNPAEPGTRYSAVLFLVVNVGAVTYPIDPVTSVIDLDGQDYGPAYGWTNAGPSLAPEDLPPGARERGYVTYLVPTGATLARVQFSTDTATATWEIK